MSIVSLVEHNELEARVFAAHGLTMSVAEVRKLPLREKLPIMEAIWQLLQFPSRILSNSPKGGEGSARAVKTILQCRLRIGRDFLHCVLSP